MNVHVHVARCTSIIRELVEAVDDVVSRDRATDIDRQALPGELVDDVEHLDRAKVARLVELKVHGPDDVRGDRAHGADLDADAGETSFLLAIGDFQALLTPQALDLLVVDAPAFVTQGVIGPSPAPAGVLRRELAQERAQLLVDLVDNDGESLGGAALANHGAGPTLRNPEPCLKLNDRLTTTVRGQNFPSAMCLSMSMSSAWFATMRLSWVFSFSSSLSFFASLAFMPPY